MSISELDEKSVVSDDKIPVDDRKAIVDNKASYTEKVVELTFRCLECDYRAVDKVHMEEHNYHLDTEKETCLSYMCIECVKVFEEDDDYQTHMQSHSQPTDKKDKDVKTTAPVTDSQTCLHCLLTPVLSAILWRKTLVTWTITL